VAGGSRPTNFRVTRTANASTPPASPATTRAEDKTCTRPDSGTRHCHRKRRYGTGADEFHALVAPQAVCAICGKEAPEHVDHSHDTGHVRGILCFDCNGGLGQLTGSAESLIAVAAYVARFASGVRELDASARTRAGELRVLPV
jgi:hypothetical protein